MPLGDVLTSPLESVLLDLGEQGATGCLYAYDQQGDQAEVYFRDGLVYSVYVPGERPMLGARLMSSGVLTPESLAEALEIQRTELRDWRLGELLVYLGFVDREVVEAFVEEQLCDMTADLLGWQVESWKFRKNRRARQDVAPPRSVQPLLDELQERVARWRQLSDSVGGMDAIPMLSAAGAPSDDVVIGPGEWALLCKVDGERSIAQLAAECGYTKYEAAEVVAALIEGGLVEVDGAGLAATGVELTPRTPVEESPDAELEQPEPAHASAAEAESARQAECLTKAARRK